MKSVCWFVFPENCPENRRMDSIELELPMGQSRNFTAQEAVDSLAVIKEINAQQETIQRFFGGSQLADVVRAVIEHHKELAVRQLRRTKEFRDDLIVWLRAMAIIADSVASASTHREKDARLRGMLEVIEGAISTLRKESFDIVLYNRSYYPFDDVFRSDYPTRQLMERIRELENQIKAIKQASIQEDSEQSESF